MIERKHSEQHLRDQIEHVASEIDEGLLSFASPEARQEWAAVCTHWRENVRGPSFAEDDLSIILTKVRRFGDILRHVKTDASPSA